MGNRRLLDAAVAAALCVAVLADPTEGRSVGEPDEDPLNMKIGGSLIYQGQLWFI
jgi:hypothetical protein